MREKLKTLFQNDQFFYSCLVILVGIIAFGLGRQSVETKTETSIPKVVFSEEKVTKNISDVPTKEEGDVSIIASKTGTKYHLVTCPGAKQIKKENQVAFNTKVEAEAAGYKPAANCPGLQ